MIAASAPRRAGELRELTGKPMRLVKPAAMPLDQPAEREAWVARRARTWRHRGTLDSNRGQREDCAGPTCRPSTLAQR
jgi:hypothetical protein